MDPLPIIGVLSIIGVSALLVNVYHICDGCLKFDWSVRFRAGTWDRNSGRSKQLCDECFGKRGKHGR